MPKVSLIVPVFNSERYLERCLESLVRQTLVDVQIIIVNDGSLDGSFRIISDFIERYPNRIESYFQPNKGTAAARNLGISHATGDYVGFVDSDDYIDETMCEKLYMKALRDDADIVVCDYYQVDEVNGTKTLMLKGNMRHYGASIAENPRTMRLSECHCWNKLFKRVLFDTTGIRFTEGKTYEDIPFTYSLFFNANRIAKVDEPLYNSTVNTRIGSISKSDRHRFDLFDCLSRLNEYYKVKDPQGIFYNELQYINLKYVYNQFENFVKYDDKAVKRDMLTKGYDHLNTYFKGWRLYYIFFYNRYGHNEMKIWLSQNFVLRLMTAILPNDVFKGFRGARYCFKELLSSEKRKRNYYASSRRGAMLAENTVLLQCDNGASVGDSLYYIARELESRNHFEIYFATKGSRRGANRRLLKKTGFTTVKLVRINSMRYQKLLATAKYLVNNATFPEYFIRRENQIYLNTWCGTPLKCYGKSKPNDIERMINEQRNFLQASYILCPNRFAYDRLVQDYNLSMLYTGKILLSGLPKNTVFFDPVLRETLREKFNLEEQEVFAYMPTGRWEELQSVGKKTYEEELKATLRSFDESLSSRQRMFVKFHLLSEVKLPMDSYKHISLFPDNVETYSFLSAVDVLITDYSGVMFDFAASKKPVALLMPDYEEYREKRGTYIDVNELPFKKFYKLADMKSFFRAGAFAASDPGNRTDLEVFHSIFNTYESGNVTSKLVDKVFNERPVYMEEKDFSGNTNSERLLYISGPLPFKGKFNALNELRATDRPVVIFNNNHANSMTRGFLNDRSNRWEIPWIISNPVMCVTGNDVLAMYHNKTFGMKMENDIFDLELQRIAPNIRFGDVKSDDDGWYQANLTRAAERTKYK